MSKYLLVLAALAVAACGGSADEAAYEEAEPAPPIAEETPAAPDTTAVPDTTGSM